MEAVLSLQKLAYDEDDALLLNSTHSLTCSAMPTCPAPPTSDLVV